MDIYNPFKFEPLYDPNVDGKILSDFYKYIDDLDKNIQEQLSHQKYFLISDSTETIKNHTKLIRRNESEFREKLSKFKNGNTILWDTFCLLEKLERRLTTEEVFLTKDIYTVYVQLREEAISKGCQVDHSKLFEKIKKWSIDHYYKEKTTNKLWEEIDIVVFKMVNPTEKYQKRIIEDELGFFKCFKVALRRKNDEYKNKYGTDKTNKNVSLTSFDDEDPDSNNDPKNTFFSKLIENDFLEAIDSALLIRQERTKEPLIALRNNDLSLKHEKKPRYQIIQEHNNRKIKKTSAKTKASVIRKKFRRDIELLNNEPDTTFLSKYDAAVICKAVDQVILYELKVNKVAESSHEKTIKCYKRYFTVFCIDNIAKIKNIEGLRSAFDSDIFDYFLEHGKDDFYKENYTLNGIYGDLHGRAEKSDEKVKKTALLRSREFLRDLALYINEPNIKFFSKFNVDDICKAVEFGLGRKNKKTKKCYRALFTVFCFENKDKINNFEELTPVLDSEILKILKSGEKYELDRIYRENNPDAQQDSAKVCAIMMLKTFLCDLKLYIDRKNQ